MRVPNVFVGAVCRWQAANPAGLVDITRLWFEHGSAGGGFDFGRTDTTSCTERSNGDQENEQRFPLRGHSRSTRALSRYILDEGTTSYTRLRIIRAELTIGAKAV